nr:reverse transcriptase domain-containing protein [Tanacetum cinerariifolium]
MERKYSSLKHQPGEIFGLEMKETTAWNEFSSTMASAVICLVTDQKFNFSKYIFDSMVKNLDSATKFLMFPRNMKRVEKEFSRRDTPLFPTMMVQAQEELGEDIEILTETHPTHTITQPSTSKPQKKQKPRKPKRQNTEEIQPSDPIINVADDDLPEDTVPTHSNDPPLLRINTLRSREGRIQLKELMKLCTKLSDGVLNLETTKTAQAKEIANLKKRDKKLERLKPEMPLKKKAQISLDEEFAFKLQAKEDKQERIIREKAQQTEEIHPSKEEEEEDDKEQDEEGDEKDLEEEEKEESEKKGSKEASEIGSNSKPLDYDGKGGAVALTMWIEIMESVIENSGCAEKQKPTTIQSAILKDGILTDEAVRCGKLTKSSEKRKEVEETSKQGGLWKDNKKEKVGKGFVVTAAPRNKPGHFARDCQVSVKQVAPISVVRMENKQIVFYECGSTEHLRNTCPKLNRALGQAGNYLALEGN